MRASKRLYTILESACSSNRLRYRYAERYGYLERYKFASTMSDKAESPVGMPLKEVVSTLGRLAHTSLAASWDNVGLLVEPTEPKVVSCILLTNDLTEDVMNEAIQLNTDLIVTYHPLIFAPLKSVTTRSWKVS